MDLLERLQLDIDHAGRIRAAIASISKPGKVRIVWKLLYWLPGENRPRRVEFGNKELLKRVMRQYIDELQVDRITVSFEFAVEDEELAYRRSHGRQMPTL